MLIECKSNDGFEDQLTVDQQYAVRLVGNGGASFQIINDKGNVGWYGESKFNLPKHGDDVIISLYDDAVRLRKTLDEIREVTKDRDVACISDHALLVNIQNMVDIAIPPVPANPASAPNPLHVV